jgi:hypothetical protein
VPDERPQRPQPTPTPPAQRQPAPAEAAKPTEAEEPQTTLEQYAETEAGKEWLAQEGERNKAAEEQAKEPEAK